MILVGVYVIRGLPVYNKFGVKVSLFHLMLLITLVNSCFNKIYLVNVKFEDDEGSVDTSIQVLIMYYKCREKIT